MSEKDVSPLKNRTKLLCMNALLKTNDTYKQKYPFVIQ